MRGKIYNILKIFIPFLWTLLILWIIILLLFFQNSTNYLHKITTIFPNSVLVFLGLLFLIIFSFIYYKFRNKINKFTDSLPKHTIIWISIILFFIQAFIFYNTYFLSGWDSNIIVNSTLNMIKHGKIGIYETYYLMYPNNLLITYIYSKLFMLSDFLQLSNHFAYPIVLVQCLGSCISGGILFAIIKDLSKTSYAYIAWFLFVIHIALNPWFSILYSDALAFIFPILIIRMYQKMKNSKHPLCKWLIIGFISYIGFKIKPTTFIVFIALGIFELLELIKKNSKKELFNKFKNLSCSLIGLIVAYILCTNIIFPSMPIKINKEKSMNVYHYLMMGLNTETNGSYNINDVLFSIKHSNNLKGNNNKIKIIKERLKKMKFNGFISHINKKMLVTYGDGTYAWGQEGGFFTEPIEKDNNVSSFFRSFYYSSATNYKYFVTFNHLIWLTIVMCSCGIIFYIKQNKKTNSIIYIIILSLIGITIFEILFEVRARYLFIYSPFYIIIALFGWICICKSFLYLKKRLK